MGGPALPRKLDVSVADEVRLAGEASESRGQTTVYLVEEGRAIAGFGLADRVGDESHAAVDALHALGTRS